MNQANNKAATPVPSAILVMVLTLVLSFIGFALFNVHKMLRAGDADAGFAAISATCFFVLGFATVIFRNKRPLLFFAALAELLLLIGYFYYFAIRHAIELGYYLDDYNWILLGFIPCIAFIAYGLKKGWHRLRLT